MFAFAIFGAFFFSVQFAHAGATDYQSPGSYSFPIPAYSTLTAQVWGAGGGGGTNNGVGYNASGGGYSVFGSVVGYGGAGGEGGTWNNGSGGGGGYGSSASGGSGGSASGVCDEYGTIYGPIQGGNGGASPSGGGGGSGGGLRGQGAAGGWPGGGGGGGGGTCDGSYVGGGGGGGGGGYSSYTYSAGQLGIGGSVTVVVGNGGASAPYGDAPGGQGGNGRVYISWTDPPPASCSVSLTPNPKSYAGSATLSWSSSNAHYWVYINNVGYVGSSGSISVSPTSSTDYSCLGNGYGGYDGWHSYVLTVNPPASCSLPWGGTLAHGGSVTAYQASSVSYGSSCVSQTRSCSNGTLSGSYQYQSCSVNNPPPTCSVSVSPTAVVQGNPSTLTWSSSNATSCTGTNFTTGGSTSGSVSVSPSSATTYTGSCTGAGGTAQCTGTGSGGVGAALAVSCTESWSCTGGGGNVITHTDTDCSTDTVTTCEAPEFCTAGSASCLYNAITGNITASPRLVGSGKTTTITWETTDAESCTVSGTNGDTWSGIASSKTSSPITQVVQYTLACDDTDPDTTEDDFTDRVTVVRVPAWLEF